MIDVMVLGEALWDLFPERPGLGLRERRVDVRHPGGAPANVATVLARLGVSTALIAAIGDDDLGRARVDELREEGVDVTHVTFVRARTGIAFVDLRDDGSRAFLPYRSPSADMLLEPAHVPDCEWSWLHLGSSSFAVEPARAASERALSFAGQRRVSIDLNVYRHLFREPPSSMLREVLARADVVKANESDLAALGLSPDERGLADLHALRPDKITLLTLGARGVVALRGAERFERSTTARPIVDETGAGDAFMAGLVAVLVRRFDDLDGALALGCELGARAVSAIGATAALRNVPRTW